MCISLHVILVKLAVVCRIKIFFFLVLAGFHFSKLFWMNRSSFKFRLTKNVYKSFFFLNEEGTEGTFHILFCIVFCSS